MATAWRAIDTAPTHGEFLVRGGRVLSEMDHMEAKDIAHVSYDGVYFVVCNSCPQHPALVIDPTEWTPIPE